MKYFLPLALLLLADPAAAQTSGGIAQSGHFQRFAARLPDTPAPCIMIVVWRDGVPTYDWACINATAAQWTPDSKNPATAWAVGLKALHKGVKP